VNRLNLNSPGLGVFTSPSPHPGSVSCVVIVDISHGRAWVRELEVRRVIVRDFMRYIRRRWCSHWTVCKCSCVRMGVVSSRVFEMSLSGGLCGG
jgi:hypothetical protein